MTAFDPEQNQTRTYLCRASADPARREISGVGVPLEEETEIYPGFRELFAQDCIFDGIDRAKLKTHHRTLIGVIASNSREPGKLGITGRVSKTPAGDEALTLAADGALDSFSIGFRFKEYERTDHEDGSFTIRHTRVLVTEFSTTDDPAYTGATVTGVREATPAQKESTMPDTLTREDLDATREEVNTLRSELSEQLRATQAQLATLGDQRAGAAPRFRSFGHFIRAYHKGDAEARAMHEAWQDAARDHELHNTRAYDGSVLADTIARDPWVGDAIRLIDKGRKVLTSFRTAPLPQEGSQVEYGVLESNTVTVGKQAAEGDTLVKGKVTVGSDTAPVGTYGGWSELSFQAVERGSVSLLDLTRRAQLIAYAQQTEAEVRALLQTTISANLAADHNLDLIAAPKAADWISLVIDAADAFEDAALPIDGLWLSKDQFKALATLADTTGRLQFDVIGNGSNSVGRLSSKEIEAELGGFVTARLLPGAANGTGAFYSEEAIITWENAGAPLALEDTNVTNLTRAYSVYGYLATAAEIPDAILPIDFAGVTPEPEPEPEG